MRMALHFYMDRSISGSETCAGLPLNSISCCLMSVDLQSSTQANIFATGFTEG